MNLEKIFFETRQGQRRLKPHMVMMASVAAFMVFILFVLLAYQRNAKGERPAPNPFAARPVTPQQKLDYDIVKLDTFSLGDYYKPAPEPSLSPVAPAPQTERAVSARPQREPTAQAPVEEVRSAASAPAAASFPSAPVTVPGSGRSMIVHSSLGSNEFSTSNVLGLQSALLKVMLPDKTPVTNNSLVLARVIGEGQWGSIEIPRRAQLLGVATLQNSRVEIQFREIRINGVTRTCTGRAYDLKRLPGIPYTPLDDKTRKVVLDELRSIASGIPIVGRYAADQEVTPFNQEVTTLEEGLEFYAQITNIF